MTHLPSHKTILAAAFSLSLLASSAVYAQPARPLPAPEPEAMSATLQPAAMDDATVATTAEENTAETTSASLDAQWEGTLMFPEKRMDDLLAIYRAYLLKISSKQPDNTNGTQLIDPDVAGTVLKNITGAKEEELPEETLQLSLNSILYNSPRDWSIWVNSKRYNRKEALEGFTIGRSSVKVIDANDHEITYQWTPIAQTFNKVQQHWEDKQRLAGKVESPQVAKGDRVEFNDMAQTVTITLRPNQTFVSQFMSVLEGVDNIRIVTPQAVAADETLNFNAQEAIVPDAQQKKSNNVFTAPPGTPQATPALQVPGGNSASSIPGATPGAIPPLVGGSAPAGGGAAPGASAPGGH